MAKRNMDWTKIKYEKFIQEGRGQGRGESYVPWLKIQDKASKGMATRLYSELTNRNHHFFSSNQTNLFYLLSWDDEITDIREHYPLLNLLESDMDKRGLDLKKYSREYTKGAPYIVTTTFLVNRGNQLQALSVTDSSSLKKKYYLELLEIVRRFWGSQQVPWQIITNKEIPKQRANNIAWILSLDKGSISLYDSELEYMEKMIMSTILMKKIPVSKILSSYDTKYGLEPGTSLIVFRNLIKKKVIRVVMDERIELRKTPEDLIIGFDERRLTSGDSND